KKIAIFVLLQNTLMLKVFYSRISDYIGLSEQILLEKVSEETQNIVRTFQNEKMRRQKCIGEAMTRILIERYGALRSGEYAIIKNEHGKPYIQALNPLYYNLSHSGDFLVCAISDKEVGIDIQQMGKEKPHLVERYFHPHEIEKLKNTPIEERISLFYRYWAAKESYLKYRGTGLSGSLSSFEILIEKKIILLIDNQKKDKIYLHECFIAPNYPCVVCSETPELPDIQFFNISEWLNLF
ncbi:MAG: 4'-phosphopantetheinyl transferase superfamily protein, partial [Odoribacter sp.]|nr:4'-phosphopantetheinyl transferase superfamily protein [Odoribacter sp.]